MDQPFPGSSLQGWGNPQSQWKPDWVLQATSWPARRVFLAKENCSHLSTLSHLGHLNQRQGKWRAFLQESWFLKWQVSTRNSMHAISCNNMQHPTTTHSWDRLGVVPTLLDCSRPMKCHLIRVLHDGMQHSDKCIAKKTKRMEALHHLWILKHGTNKTEPWLAMMWIKIFQQFSSWWFQLKIGSFPCP